MRLALLATLLLAAGTVCAQTVVLRAAGLVDVLAGEAVPDAVVVVDGGRIIAAGRAATVEVPQDSHVIDLGDQWLLPGLMNMHVHLDLLLPGTMAATHANESEAELVLRMADNAHRSLLSGVTTVRQPAMFPSLAARAGRFTDRATMPDRRRDARPPDVALARAIERGVLPGPRLITAGEMVNITGGHGAAVTPLHDGPYDMRKATRYQIRAGATWIKLAISGGIATPVGGIGQPLMTRDEIEAVVDIAGRHGVRVTAHVGSAEAARVAVEAGVNGLEHGYFLDRDILRLMRDHGTWFVPTIVVSQPATFDFFERIGSPEWYMERVREVGRDHWRALEMAIEEGVNIALGSDQHPFEPNDGTTATVREAEYYVEAGMTPLQALRAATIDAARMLGMDDSLGALSPGFEADIVAVDGNPMEDISALRTLGFVMREGRVYRNDWE